MESKDSAVVESAAAPATAVAAPAKAEKAVAAAKEADKKKEKKAVEKLEYVNTTPEGEKKGT